MKKYLWILWPAFLIAIPATGVYFSIFDPRDMSSSTSFNESDRGIIYTLGFIIFWLIGIASSALTIFLNRSEP